MSQMSRVSDEVGEFHQMQRQHAHDVRSPEWQKGMLITKSLSPAQL